MDYLEIETAQELIAHLAHSNQFAQVAFQQIDFTPFGEKLMACEFRQCIFLGCTLPFALREKILTNNKNYIFPQLDVPFQIYPNKLYSADTLMANYELHHPESYALTPDKIIYNHYLKTGKEARSIDQSLARRLHDHSITDALYDFIGMYDEHKLIGIMGGHSLSRASRAYAQVALLSQKLTKLGFLMISGGGPGAMEATHLGAWFAGKPESELNSAISKLQNAPYYNHPLWLDKAFEVMSDAPNPQYESLGIPTWLYGHEPPTPFATKIAKYFANSVREDGLLTIAKGGIIYSPGSAGTVQEIFQDATQNHYLSTGYSSPMIFLGKKFWTSEMPVFSFLECMLANGKYQNLKLFLCDRPDEVVDRLTKNDSSDHFITH